MLYEALSQPYIFLWMTAGGFLCGFLFDVQCALLFLLNKKTFFKRFLVFFKHFFTFFSTFLSFSTLFIINLKVNYGQFRFFTVFAFALAFALERFFVSSFLANPIKKCYNSLEEKRRIKKENGRKRRAETTNENPTSEKI